MQATPGAPAEQHSLQFSSRCWLAATQIHTVLGTQRLMAGPVVPPSGFIHHAARQHQLHASCSSSALQSPCCCAPPDGCQHGNTAAIRLQQSCSHKQLHTWTRRSFHLPSHTPCPHLSALQVTYVQGWGTISSPNEVSVGLLDGGSTKLSTKNIMIATGSEVTALPGVPIDEEK